MISASRQRAETQFSAIEKRQQRALTEQQEASRAVDENMARLKAMRLAREEGARADKDARTEASVRKLTAKRAAL